MSARDDYPHLAELVDDEFGILSTDAGLALDEIDQLRALVGADAIRDAVRLTVLGRAGRDSVQRSFQQEADLNAAAKTEAAP